MVQIIVAGILIGLHKHPAIAQNNGGVEISASPDTTQDTNQDSIAARQDTTSHSPLKASLYSMVLPGLGQAYNNEYWKIPIIYSGGLVMGYFIDYFNTNYHIYRRGILAQKGEGPPRNNPFPDYVSQDRLSRGKDFFRRNRDFVMILSAGLYLLQIVDAHVDAHLKDFNITEDLSIQINPNIENYALQSPGLAMNNYQTGIGFSVNLKFNQ